ncbi:hypothetical protein LEP1GSC125_0858 [Leptospira mayottensis 200901122]|uniref:Uncharacterized protein n=1 Tax=Leptospira mayottensis 200901122 TaxID=1193010 RepID=A0AA87MQW9_9LEPT|nr:hypothetical protein LEP1GSC125_0858 [Leptospira mayottensis 200901122]
MDFDYFELESDIYAKKLKLLTLLSTFEGVIFFRKRISEELKQNGAFLKTYILS